MSEKFSKTKNHLSQKTRIIIEFSVGILLLILTALIAWYGQ